MEKLFPTHVGLNRWIGIANLLSELFPTHVGLNRLLRLREARRLAFPHTRGVEPAHLNNTIAQALFSPHTWG